VFNLTIVYLARNKQRETHVELDDDSLWSAICYQCRDWRASSCSDTLSHVDKRTWWIGRKAYMTGRRWRDISTPLCMRVLNTMHSLTCRPTGSENSRLIAAAAYGKLHCYWPTSSSTSTSSTLTASCDFTLAAHRCSLLLAVVCTYGCAMNRTP